MEINELIEYLQVNLTKDTQMSMLIRERPSTISIDLSHLLDRCPSSGLYLSKSLSLISMLKQCILHIQKHILNFAEINPSFTLELSSSPFVYRSIEEIPLNQVFNIDGLKVSSIGECKMFKESAEYLCTSCSDSFIVFAEIAYSNQILPPNACNVIKKSSLVPSSMARASKRVESECSGTEFYVLDNSFTFSDYQEIVLSDGTSSILGILIGNSCNTVSPGEVISITAIKFLKWVREPSNDQPCDITYSLLVSHIQRKASFSRLRAEFSVKTDFEKRAALLRSSFSNCYGNYHLRYGLLLNMVAHLSGINLSTLIIGETATGKSSLLKQLPKLCPSVTVLNGALTYKSALHSEAIKNSNTGKLEAGLLQSDSILAIDDFHLLQDNSAVFRSMEKKSVIAAVTSYECETYEDRDVKMSKKYYSTDMKKGMPLNTNIDRFDLILKTQELDFDKKFIRTKLEDSLFEDSTELWDTDNIKEYLSASTRNVIIKNNQVQSILESFIQFCSVRNMKNGDNRCTSVRFLESLLKTCKATALLMGHDEVTVQDAFDVILFVHLSGSRDSTIVNQSLVNHRVYEEEVCSLIRYIKNYIGL